jgi:hypothetical protein
MPSISYLSVIILVVLLISIGIWLFRIGRYPAFYFSLCGLFVINIFLFLYSIKISANSFPENETLSEVNGELVLTRPGYFLRFNLMDFSTSFGFTLLILLTILSASNFFMPKNNGTVKFLSGFIFAACLIIFFLLFLISKIGKIGG